jgi:hypothetical protein
MQWIAASISCCSRASRGRRPDLVLACGLECSCIDIGKPYFKTMHWSMLMNEYIFNMAAMREDIYVVKLFEPVFNLSFKQGLGFEDQEHTGQICNDGDDYLLVPGWQPPRVPIVAVHALTMDQQDQLLRAAGKPVPRPRAAAQPAPPKS